MYIFKYILKRIALMLFVFFVIVTMCFVLVKLLPNLPAEAFGKDMELILKRRELLGYDLPIMQQYGRFLKYAVRGNFGYGETYKLGSEVWQVFVNRLPYTMVLNSNEAIESIGQIVNAVPQYEKLSYTGGRTIELMDAMKEIGVEKFSEIEGVAEFFAKGGEFPDVSLFGLNLSQIPSVSRFDWLLLIPVLTFIVYFFSAKLTRKLTYQPTTADDAATGCSNKMMDWMMPLMSVYICFIVPAAVGVYWIFKSIIGVIKQFILKKLMPIPTFTEAEYKAAEKEYGAKSKPQKAKSDEPKKAVRSLHHIDDEDFADTAPAAAERKKALEEAKKAEVEEKKASPIAEAPIKEDDRYSNKSEDSCDSEKN